MSRKWISVLLPLCLATGAGSALAGGDAAAGERKSGQCQACHGADGRATDPAYPVLAGQHESYLVKALEDYRSGDRKNALMGGIAVNLSDQDIEDLAAWYAGMEGLKDLSVR